MAAMMTMAPMECEHDDALSVVRNGAEGYVDGLGCLIAPLVPLGGAG